MEKQEVRKNLMCFSAKTALRLAWLLEKCDFVMDGSLDSKEGPFEKEKGHGRQRNLHSAACSIARRNCIISNDDNNSASDHKQALIRVPN